MVSQLAPFKPQTFVQKFLLAATVSKIQSNKNEIEWFKKKKKKSVGPSVDLIEISEEGLELVRNTFEAFLAHTLGREY